MRGGGGGAAGDCVLAYGLAVRERRAERGPLREGEGERVGC